MILIKNGRVMDPETGFDKVTDLVLSGGKIKSIGNTETADFEQIIDAEVRVVAPGLILSLIHIYAGINLHGFLIRQTFTAVVQTDDPTV